MPRVRPLSLRHDPAPRRVTIHLIDCNCPACDRDYHRKAAIETVAMFAIGFVTAWLTDWALGGPGLQIMIGL
ncbi:hypothetical protein ASE70_05760 [Sphingomonas sp. Leaf22]|uniref:hypothetical protein n=1 Tax=unclassified Sphingomonas TaxID=196159 RepID=UPI0006F97CEE|nr:MULTISPECIES: hypothetical protein [unclassified Sphingomonas]KQM79373.1 hypothetical protein ASE70_05760 [Sphingomonas sp. Leaf22]KQN72094.1 hypothetical protein ASE91_05395 [Sphingomonas sp. Leaf62]